MIKKVTLENGLKLILVPMSGTSAVTSLVLFGTGSRYETRPIAGIAHFLEHMFFKGTKKRPTTFEISRVIDGIGGEFNAFTSKEYTGYYTKVAVQHFETGFELLADLLQHSLFNPVEIDRERGVILEEMKMYIDNPVLYIESLFEQTLYPNQPLGDDTIGRRDSILNVKRPDFLSFVGNYYHAGNATIVLAGAISDVSKTTNMISQYFGKVTSRQKLGYQPVVIRQQAPQMSLVTKNTEQTNVAVGVRTFPIGHLDRYILSVMSAILGEGMSSRLFIKVREREGLAYYIRSTLGHFMDDGYLMIQAGVDHQKIRRVLQIIIAELSQLAAGEITDEEIRRAKDFIHGKTALRMEDSEDQANFYSLQSVLEGTSETIEQRLAKIEAVTKPDLARVARTIFSNERLNLALISEHKSDIEIKKYLKF